MLARIAADLPAEGDFLFEPKWDGFRAIVFRRDGDVYIQSRDRRPFDRYFPDLHEAFLAQLPEGCVVDGEIVIATRQGLDFDALQLRLHPAASRVAMTRDREKAREWLDLFEGAGLDGVMAKPASLPYEPGKRSMIKVKHVRSADCVVAGFRWHKTGHDAVGSLLLGLYDDAGMLHHVGVTSSFTMAVRRELVAELEPLRKNAMKNHPWRDWGNAQAQEATRMPGGSSRWSAGKDLSWELLRIERTCEVKYDHLQGERFRHAAIFMRWRPDKPPRDCRYDQLEAAKPFELSRVFAARRRAKR